MREFVVSAPYQIEFREVAEPNVTPHEVRVRAIVSGIKHGTELTLYRGHTPFATKQFDPEYRMFMPQDDRPLYPLNLGSWLVGEVVEIGNAVTRFHLGDRVHGPMPHRPINVIAEDALYPLLSTMQPETALFTDPAIFALAAIHDAQIKLGDQVAIFGMGALGLLAVQFARMSGAQTVIAVDTIAERLSLASVFGAHATINAAHNDPALAIKNLTGKKGVDVAVDISGSYAALHTAIRCIHVCGRVVSASYYSGTCQLELGAEWHHNRPTFVSSMPVWGNPHRCYPMWDMNRLVQTALRMLETGQVETTPMIGKRFPYSDAAQAYQFIDQHPQASIKTLLDYANG